MAIAGRVAIVPKGEYSNAVTYDKLDLVMFNNDAYVAKKASTGIEPTNDEYWMLILNNVVAEDLEKIIDGTTPVGNANKLDGKDASEYALDADLKNIKSSNGTWVNSTGWYRIAKLIDGVDSVDEYYCKIAVTLAWFASSSETHVIECSASSGNPVLTTTHDKVSGSQTVTKVRLTTEGSAKYIEIYYSAKSSTSTPLHYYVMEHSCCWKAIEAVKTSETVSGVTVSCTYNLPNNAIPITSGTVSDYALPNSGGNVTADVTIGKKSNAPYLRLESIGAISVRLPNGTSEPWDRGFKIVTEDGTDLGGLGILGSGRAVTHYYMGGTYNNPILSVTPSKEVKVNGNEVLHTGNKPSGSYTGNGSATSRTINVGGIGSLLYIYCSMDGTGALVWSNGCITFSGSVVTPRDSSFASFSYSTGVLTINTADSYINGSGKSYKYYVL